MSEKAANYKNLMNSLIGGGVAGLVADTTLYPIDTIKTRLQSKQGFLKSGGFRSVYAGFAAVSAGSVPGAALFFVTYDYTKSRLASTRGWPLSSSTVSTQVLAASVGETVACLVRVPVEVIKQKTQVGQAASSAQSVKLIATTSGIRGFYRGFTSTVLREIPFAAIQFPLWEYLKRRFSSGKECSTSSSAIAGFIAGGLAAFITTPLDVIKTRTMLKSGSYESPLLVLSDILSSERRLQVLFAGAAPRTFWISAGGFIFLGSYQFVMNSILPI